MSGQSANMSRSEAISKQKSIERGPGATPKGSKDPNTGSYPKGHGIAVPTK